jgi:3-oxoacyl-[acyl-carrier-protein] synthase-3
MIRTRITGCGAYLPETILTNAELAARIDTTDEWIVQRTGIRQRHIAAAGQKTSDLAVEAARKALASAGLQASDIDMIVVATTTPDQTFPATAAIVQDRLGLRTGFAFDMQAVCSGFVYALATADNFIKAGQVKRALVIGAETFSRIVDWTDRTTCVLFGDGAGAVVLEASDGADGRGILSTHLHSDGSGHGLLYTDGGASSGDTVGKVRMNGKEVFKHAVTRLAEVVDETLAANDIPPSALDWLVPHQANARIIESTAKKLGMDESKVVLTVDRHANTSAASIPLALAEAVGDGRIQTGNLVLLEAMGGGLTWGAALVRWG